MYLVMLTRIEYTIHSYSTEENHKVVDIIYRIRRDISRKRIIKSWTLPTRSWTLAM